MTGPMRMCWYLQIILLRARKPLCLLLEHNHCFC
uniref:Hypothetical frame-3 protein n=1 Tax=Seriola quinqueradiata TaxID=8161 RepID=Q76K98_SERQU|nr:hypothetical frame-3 protein [Seriola quinqueradiata]BAC99060.1 hypothetical frame-3 protein [Seriola quinqueradiata]BAC99063.1 hypothetical frame-3 protein [Seriola quinqueradiata]BAC99066.1 hypothetical frame-3 protein [Seriola quinqueradiata]BAC99069.1 hypothetical frame-3 protein [Seriola quinqueradiata]